MRGPTGPMGLTGRPGPLVCISNHLTASTDILCQKYDQRLLWYTIQKNEHTTVCS